MNEGCYWFATVDVLAGAKTCRDCPIENSQAVSVDESYLAHVTLEPDRLVNEVLSLMPQTIDRILTITLQLRNNNLPDTHNLDDYIQSILKRAYVVLWDTILGYMEGESTNNMSSDIKLGVAATKAVVSLKR